MEVELELQLLRQDQPVPRVLLAAALPCTASAVALAGMALHAAHRDLARCQTHTTPSAYKLQLRKGIIVEGVVGESHDQMGGTLEFFKRLLHARNRARDREWSIFLQCTKDIYDCNSSH